MKDTDLFIDPNEGTITLNSPAKRNSFMDTPSKLVGVVILLILLVVVIVYFKSGRNSPSVQQVQKASEVAWESPSHPVPGARPGQVEGEIAVPPGVETVIYKGLKGDLFMDQWFKTTSPLVKFVITFNGSPYQRFTNSASALPLPKPRSTLATNGTRMYVPRVEEMSIFVPTNQDFTNLTVRWVLSQKQ